MGQRTTDGVARPPRPDVSYEAWLARPEDARPSEWVDGEVVELIPPKTIHQAIIVLLTQSSGCSYHSGESAGCLCPRTR
jgi:hypothetical protein